MPDKNENVIVSLIRPIRLIQLFPCIHIHKTYRKCVYKAHPSYVNDDTDKKTGKHNIKQTNEKPVTLMFSVVSSRCLESTET